MLERTFLVTNDGEAWPAQANAKMAKLLITEAIKQMQEVHRTDEAIEPESAGVSDAITSLLAAVSKLVVTDDEMGDVETYGHMIDFAITDLKDATKDLEEAVVKEIDFIREAHACTEPY